MSGKKCKGASPWSACDNCNVIIAQKEAARHKEKCCPPDFQYWAHPFIYIESLYANLGVFQLDDQTLDFIPKEERNDIVLMPCHVLQLCKIPIGDHVLVRTSECEKSVQLVKTAWPIQEKTSDFNILFSSEVAELYDLKPKSQVIASKMQERISHAKSVTLLCISNICTSTKKSLFLRLQRQNIDKVLCIGNKLLIRHYGTKVVFQVIEITKEDEVVTEDFCFVSAKTLWKLNKDEKETLKSKNLLKTLGGLDLIIAELRDSINLAFSRENFLSGVHITRGILIYGPAGTGKTTLMEAITEQFTDNVVKIECTKIFSKFLGETEKELTTLFDKAKQISPCLILIDDLDILCGKSNSTFEFEKRIIATLSKQMDNLNDNPDPSIVVLATTSKIHQIDKMLRCPSRFGKEIELYVPGNVQRFEILKCLLINVNHNLNTVDMKSVADSLHGFVGADMVSLVSKAVLKSYKSSQGKKKVSIHDFQWALGKVRPSALREVMIDVPNVKWDDIGGQHELKLKLRQCIEWPLKYSEAFSKLGITPPKGVLMFGPPGCSKTMIAKAIATESQLNFISVKGPELFSKWVGESEKAIREVFRRARETAPSIIFFDELDAMGGRRDISASSNVQERVLAQLLVELDGVESLDNVTIIGATNRLDLIDPALLRPGRLDRIIYVPLPDSNTRREIFLLQLSKTCVSEDVSVDELVQISEGYSAAEIVAISREAALKALEENFNAEVVTRKHFMEAFNIVLPRTPKSLLELYDKYLIK